MRSSLAAVSPAAFAVSLRFVVAAAVLTAVNAHAFCRAVTEDVPAGFDPAQTGACFSGDGQALELYWRNRCVSYSVQKDASALRGITFEQARAAALQAFGAWNAVTCDGAPVTIQASELEPTTGGGVTCDQVQYDEYGPNQHVIVFRDGPGWGGDASNTLGLTTISYDTTTGEIFDADIEINSHDFALAVAPVPAGAYDLVTVLTHEAGHFLGLGHSADATAIMYAHYGPTENGLTPDDTAGLCAIDRSDGTRATSLGPVDAEACDPTPRHGFASGCAPEDDGGNVLPPVDAAASAAGPGVTTAGTPADASPPSHAGWLPPPRSAGGSCAASSAPAHAGGCTAFLALLAALAGARRARAARGRGPWCPRPRRWRRVCRY